VALKEGPYPVRKCPSVNQKFHAEFGVAKEEPDGPGLGLVILPGKHIPIVTSTPYAFPMGGVAETRKAPSFEGALSSLAPGKKRAPSVVSENAPHGTLP